MRNVYLDSSSVVKRYVQESGSEVVDEVYDDAEAGVLKLTFSIWNVGEVLGAVDKYFTRGVLSEKERNQAISDFTAESVKLGKLGALYTHPITAEILLDSWLLILRRHLYEADALQIVTAKTAGCDVFLTADASLIHLARLEDVAAFDVETETEEVRARLAASE